MSRLSQDSTDAIMKDAAVVEINNRHTEYTKHTSLQQEMYIHYVFEKTWKNDAVAKLANINTHTARKCKAEYIANPEAGVPPPKKRQERNN